MKGKRHRYAQMFCRKVYINRQKDKDSCLDTITSFQHNFGMLITSLSNTLRSSFNNFFFWFGCGGLLKIGAEVNFIIPS